MPLLLTLIMMITAPFGTWKSPITSDSIVQGSVLFFEMQASDEGLYWLELHPKEKGRVALIRYDGQSQKTLFDEVSIRSRVHEYGGGAFCLSNGAVIYSNDADRQLYREGQKLTDAPNWRFADGCGSIWVGEKHDGDVQNCLVRIEDGQLEILAEGHDFYSSPRLSPDGKKLAFITWDFPWMQWDSSTLWIADIGEDQKLHHLEAIAGGPNESVCQIQWSPEGILHFVSDKTGFWNLYRYKEERAENLHEKEAEFGLPAWVFGRPTYTFLSDGTIICMYAEKGIDYLGKLDPETKTLTDLEQPFTMIQSLVTYRDKVYFFGSSPTLAKSIICYDPKTNESTSIKQSFETLFADELISTGELVEYPTKDGQMGYAIYFPPKNPNYRAPEGELPPVIVRSHGGPTDRVYNTLSLTTQYWTSRGFGFLDVNYGGSTGFGREYMKRLEGNWGIVDVDDCISAVQSLVDQKRVDPHRLLIQGGSAGGYTTLAALAFHDIFAGGTSLYGVSDLELLCKDTHKFEGKYNDILVAPYPDQIELIRERSPITHVDKIHTPILLLQGDEDKIVPPNQSQAIYDALVEKKIPVGMIIFEGEGHGFRKADNIKRSLDAQLYFYSEILGLALPEPFEEPPVDIVK